MVGKARALPYGLPLEGVAGGLDDELGFAEGAFAEALDGGGLDCGYGRQRCHAFDFGVCVSMCVCGLKSNRSC